MNGPRDVPPKFWDRLRRGLYALSSEVAAAGGGLYGDRWEFVMEDDDLLLEHDEEGRAFLVYEETA